MKRLLLATFLFSATFCFAQTTSQNYSGNGKNGFGGAVGQGTINIRETPDSVFFTLTKGPGVFDSVLVFYVDGIAGGISTTAGLVFSGSDPYVTATAGTNGVNSAVLNFPSTFQPDGAIAFDKNGGKVYYFYNAVFFTAIVEGSSFTVTPSGTNTSATYSFASSKAALGLSSGPISFNFIGTYIGPGASRSNEAFGDPFTGYLRTTGTERSYVPYTVQSFYTFASSALPVTLVDFNAAKDGSNVTVNWSVAQETNIDQYEVQRSADQVNYSTVATVKARNSSVANSYSVTDAHAAAGVNYYRLVITEKGKTEISKVASINLSDARSVFAASYQSGNNLNVVMKGLKAGNYTLSVVNSVGQVMQLVNLQHDGTDQTRQVMLHSNLVSGVYRVALQSGKTIYTAGIMVQ